MEVKMERAFGERQDGWFWENGTICARYICPECGEYIVVNDDWPTEAKCRCRSYRLVVAVKLETWGEE